MTKTRIYDFLRGFNPLYVAIALSMLMLAGIIMLRGIAVWNADTPTYVGAWDEYYSHGEIDIFRTPVYPVIIGIGKILFGTGSWVFFPTIIQIIVFYACGIVFSKMILEVISDRRVAWFTVFLYFLFYPIINMLNVIGTEALAFSLTALWIYCIWRFIQRPGWKYGIYISLLTVTGIMLRPSFLIFAIAIAGLAVAGVFIRNYRRNVLLLLLTLLPVGVVYKIYVNEVERKSGLNTISVVSVINKYYMSRQYKDIFPEFLPDNPKAIELMNSYQEREDLIWLWTEISHIEKDHIMSYQEMEDYALAMKHTYPGLWYGYIGKRIIDSVVHEKSIKNMCNYLVVTLYTIFFIVGWIRFRRFSHVNFLILMIGGGSLLSIFLYAQNDFGRLMLPTSAVLILMGGQLLNCIRLHPLSIKLRRMYPL